ncbi:DoxX family protein [Rhizobium paranaense]|uniref:Putative oxidoreductase n=1 Tax=Rhizobium paranaense TaxID=1650438 RepID=A0A7W8XX54_9HYPH|nr:DoxX family protein [Rhizobium paranaense]MBB5576990.1 putative oxidoreductase [Rhizobium paranaense]
MIDIRTAPYAALALRLSMGSMFVAHSAQKLFVYTPTGTAQFFVSIGLPGWLAYPVIAWELIGGLALIFGVYARFVAAVSIPLLLGTIFSVHAGVGFFFDNPHGGWEFPAFWTIGLFGLACVGDGPLAAVPTPSLVTRRAKAISLTQR